MNTTILELLWKCQIDKHEDIIRSVYDTIRELIEYMNFEEMKFILNKFRGIPLEKYDEKLLNFMKDFSLKAYATQYRNERLEKMNDIDLMKDDPNSEKSKKNETEVKRNPTDNSIIIPSSDNLFCMPIFWSLIQDEMPISAELTEISTNAFKDLLSDQYCASQRLQYVYLCLENLKKNKSVSQSLQMAITILLIVNNQKMLHEINIKDWIALLYKEYPILDLIIDSFVLYFAETDKKLIQTDKIGEEINEKVFTGKYKHSYNLDTRFKFLYNFLNLAPKDVALGKERIQKLWNLFMENNRPDYDSKAFLKWIANEKEIKNTMVPINIFDKEENIMLLEILCKNREKLVAKYDIIYFKAFSKQFRLVNSIKGAMDIKHGLPKIIKINELLGLDALWENVSYCKNFNTWTKFNELIICVYTNISELSKGNPQEILSVFINKAMQQIVKSDPIENEICITNLSKLLLSFFDLIDGNKYIEQDDSDFHFQRYYITVICPSTNSARKFDVGMDITVGQLRKKIANEFGLSFKGFQMMGKSAIYEHEDNDSLLRSVGWSTQIQIKPLVLEHENDSKLLISENHAYITHLFLLLSKESCSFVEPVWELLMTLPFDQKMLNDIRSLTLPESGWNSLLDTKSVHKFLYALQIIEQIVTPPSELEENVEIIVGYKRWISQFCKKDGLKHLFNAFLELPISSLHHQLSRKCFGLLLKVLSLIQAAGYSLENNVTKFEQFKESMVERILIVLESFAQASIASQSQKLHKSPKKQKPKINSAEEESDPSQAEQSLQLQKNRKKHEEDAKIFEYAFALIKGPKNIIWNYFEQMSKFDIFKELLLKGLILSDNEILKKALANEILMNCRIFKLKEITIGNPNIILLPFMLQIMIRETLHRDSNCEQFYLLLCSLIRELTPQSLEKIPINYHDTLAQIADFTKEHPICEHNTKEIDTILVGLIKTIESLLEKFPLEREFVGQKCGIINELLHKCLFEFPEVAKLNRLQTPPPPKCKSQTSRLAAFNLLCVLSRDSSENLLQICKYLQPIHAKGAWRTKRTSDWNIMPEISEKSATGYVGLKNLGCTCYMNSLLQQLFMIPSFRNDILAVEDPKKNKVDPEENMLYQIQCLFAALNESVKQSYNPKIFCHAFKDWDGKPINVLEQMDVDEFFNLLMDKLENAIKGTVQENSIKQHFGGLFANQLLCKDCPHSGDLSEPFLALNLQVKNKKSLQQCLESFVEGEMLQGNNAYHCEKCDKKVTTLKRVCIKRLPKHLIFVLKRFDINYDTMQKFKINDYCEFPMKLNMEPYTAEGLAKKDKEKEREKAKKEGRDLDEIPQNPNGPKKICYPPEYYEYKLSGVVIHMGTADTGHYYSLAMDREKEWLPEKERWYEFNDTLVDQYDPEEIKDDAFGGEEKMHGFEGMSFRPMEKIRNAYLLVYERISPYEPPDENEQDEDTNSKEKSDASKKSEKIISTAKVPEPIHSAIIQENMKYWHSKYMFHEDYFEFAFKLCSYWNSLENIIKSYSSHNLDYNLLNIDEKIAKIHSMQSNSLDDSLQIIENSYKKSDKTVLLDPTQLEKIKNAEIAVFKYACTLLFTTIFRASTKNYLPEFIDLLKAYMNKNIEAGKWIITQFMNTKILHEFLFECCDTNMRRLVSGLLYCAMLNIYKSEKTLLLEYNSADLKKPNSLLINFINFLFAQLPICRKYTIYFEQYLQLFARIAFLGPEMRSYLLKNNGLKTLIGFWGNIAETNWNNTKEFIFEENNVPELGIPSEVDERFQSPFEEYYTQKREKILQNAQPSYTFLIQAIAILLRGTTFSEKVTISKYALEGCKLMLGIDSSIKNLFTMKNIYELIKDSSHSICLLELVKGIQNLCWENPEFKMQTLKAILNGINVNDYDDVRNYFYFFKELINIDDAGQISFLPIALYELDTVMKNNMNAFLATIMSIKNILWIIKEVPVAAEWYKQNNEKWAWILNWLKENPYPTLSSVGNVRPYKSKLESMKVMNRYDSMFSTESQYKWSMHIKWITENLEKLKSGIILCFTNKR